MNKQVKRFPLILIYAVVLIGFILSGFYGSRAITVLSENAPVKRGATIVIDAGHGGPDGGATSCSGVLESNINLDIAFRLDDLLHLLGFNTVMIRTSDTSIHTTGNTIAQKKVSDLKERVRIVNQTDGAILVSIHQNHFSDSRYCGAQVFYAPNNESIALAEMVQSNLIQTVNIGSNRQVKKADGIYLMQHINCTGVLIECGFLSNPTEEQLLRDGAYQKKLCCVIASTLSSYLMT